MANYTVKNEVFEDLSNSDIIFRNFSGTPDAYNQSGKRQYSIVLTPDRAADLAAKGWNVKVWGGGEDDPGTSFLPVEVKYGAYPPKVYLMSGKSNPDGSIDILNKTLLDEATVSELDHANFEKVDVIITPYVWEWNGRTGVKAYTKAIYATVVMDPLELKYANVGNPEGIYEDEYVELN